MGYSQHSSENINYILLHFILGGIVNLQRSENGFPSGSYEMFKDVSLYQSLLQCYTANQAKL